MPGDLPSFNLLERCLAAALPDDVSVPQGMILHIFLHYSQQIKIIKVD